MRLAIKAGGLAVLLALGLAPAGSAATRVVKAKDIIFTPAKVSIKRGGTVSWRFVDSTRHNVISTGKRRFRSSRDMQRGTHRVRFRKAGRYRYMCTFHPLSMRGVVTVR